MQNQANNWDFWIEVLPTIGQQVQQVVVIPEQLGIVQDLNEIPEPEDP